MSYEGFLRYSGGAYIAVGLGLLLFPKEWFPSFYDPVFMGSVALASPFLVYLPKMSVNADTPEKRRTVMKIRAMIMASLIMGGIGELGLYQLYRIGFEYDKLAHFTISMLLTFMCVESLMAWKHSSFRKLLWLVAPSVLIAGILWEGLEAASDTVFGTEVWGIYGSFIARDTLWDIYFNTFGILAGMIALLTRHPRAPRENRSVIRHVTRYRGACSR